ncbi:MAG: hypothetical protein TQ35_0008375 [Candidatus Aramenus sulfurataquae]|uniref:Uncharacterized protein n=1 Tax=Candidatus Aramenus sulfurataquae TaxID=1326980 RepID=A0ACC6TQP8_9CREN
MPEVGISPDTHSVIYLFMYIIPITNIIILAKIYLIILFTVIYFILWVLTDKILDILNIHSFAVKILTILLFYLLPLYMQLLASNYFNVILGILSISYVLINLVSMQNNAAKFTKKSTILSGIALGFSAIMDPRFYIWFIYIIAVFLLAAVVVDRKSFIRIIKGLLGIFIVSLPFVGYVYFVYIYPSLITTSLHEAIAFSAIRPDTLNYIAGFSQNSNFIYLLTFISSWWPSVIPSSPSILFYPRDKWFYLPAYGFNDQVLMPNDLISHIWFFSLFIFIFIVFISIFDKNRRKVSSELLLPLLFMIAVESGTNFPIEEFTYVFDVLPSKLPIIGGIMSTAFAIPFYAEWLNVSISLILAPIGFNYMINYFGKIKIKRVDSRFIIGIALVLIMSFASWQYFNGTLYPGPRTGSFPGNSVSLQGDYYPLNPPPQWIHVMDILSKDNAGRVYVGDIGFSERWTNYQFILYSPPLMPGWATIGVPQTQSLSQTPLAYDIAGIKYLFIDNTSYIPLSNSFIYDYLNHSGLLISYAKDCVYLLEQPNASLFRYSYEALYYNGSNETLLDVLWDLYPLLNYTPAIVTPIKVQNSVPVVVNSPEVLSDQISVYNLTKPTKVKVNAGDYIVFNNTANSRFLIDVENEENLTLKGILVFVPEKLNFTALISYPLNFTFNQFTTAFSLDTPKGVFVTSSLPIPSALTSNGEYLGHDVFGRLVFISQGNMSFWLKYGEMVNLLMTTVDLFFYSLFIYFIIYKRGIKQLMRMLSRLYAS